MATSTNSWLRQSRKSDLVEVAENTGLKNYETLKKVDLEAKLDEYLAENAARFSSRSDIAGYYAARSKALGSPVKREKENVKDEAEKGLKVVRRRATKAADEIANETESAARATSSALVQTPGRSLSQVAARIPLPATPADIANSVDRSTLVVRQRVSSMYHDSGFSEASNATREALSTVTSVLYIVNAVELYNVFREVLPARYAFTIPAVGFLGSPDYPVSLPDMFLLVTASFWAPAFTWALTSFILPSFAGYFVNLSATSSSSAPRTRARASTTPEHPVDPLTFSIVKALVSFLVYAQGSTIYGLLSPIAIERLDSAVYGGHKGMLTGAAITGLVSIYDAVLKK